MVMRTRKIVLESQLLPGPRKRWYSKGKAWINLLRFVFKVLGYFLKLVTLVGHICSAIKKLMDVWPG